MRETTTKERFSRVLRKALELNNYRQDKIQTVMTKLNNFKQLNDCYCIEDFIVTLRLPLSKQFSDIHVQMLLSDMINIVNVCESIDDIMLLKDF